MSAETATPTEPGDQPLRSALDPASAVVDVLGETAGADRASAVASVAELTRGETVGRFIVLDRLGHGGMGVVHSAYDPELDRKVAVKLVLPERRGGAGARARFLREAQAMARLAHPNVVGVYDVGSVGERIWIAMEFVVGRTVTRWLAEQRRSWRVIVDVFVQAGEGLRAAHAAGLVHRDFKPDNMMIGDDGRVRVMDFGLARAGPADESLPAGERAGAPDVTQAGQIVGTPRYMAPEQWEGRTADAQADQFAFCVALWEALYGHPPFGAGDLPELVTAVIAGDIRTPPNVASVPRWVRQALRRGLAVAPQQRWPSMTALLAALDRRPRQRRWSIAGLAVAGLTAVVLAARPGEDACAAAGESISAVWDRDRRDAVEASFLGTGLVYAGETWTRVARDLDDYASAWAAEATRSCSATDDEAGARELVQLCLERRRLEFRALVDVLAAGKPEVVEHASQAVRRLTPPGACRDSRLAELEASLPLPDDPLAVSALQERLVRVTAEELAGQYDAALTAVLALETDAAAVGYLPLIAEVAFRRGTILAHQFKNAAADAALVEAIAAAERAGHDLIRAEAMVARIEVAGYRLQQPELMLSWIPMTEALVSRVHPDSALEALLWTNAGLVAQRSYRFEEAEAQHRRALALLERLASADGPERIAVLIHLGSNLKGQERRSESIAVLEEAEALARRTLGPEHPMLVLIYTAIGNSQFDPAVTLGYVEKARALTERTLGPHHPAYAASLANLAELQMYDGEHAAAQQNYARAVEIIAAAYGESHPHTAGYLCGLGEAQARAGELAAARETYRRAASIYEEHPWSPEAAIAVGGLASIHELEGQWEEARALYRRASDIIAERTDESPTFAAHWLRGEALALLELGRPAEAADLARDIIGGPGKKIPLVAGPTRFVLARALHALGDHEAALAEAEAALAELSTQHWDAGAHTAAIEDWLADVRTPSSPPRPPRPRR